MGTNSHQEQVHVSRPYHQQSIKGEGEKERERKEEERGERGEERGERREERGRERGEGKRR